MTQADRVHLPDALRGRPLDSPTTGGRAGIPKETPERPPVPMRSRKRASAAEFEAMRAAYLEAEAARKAKAWRYCVVQCECPRCEGRSVARGA